MDRTANGKEATRTWHDMIIPPAPERTLHGRDEEGNKVGDLDLRIYLAMETRNDNVGDDIGATWGGWYKG